MSKSSKHYSNCYTCTPFQDLVEHPVPQSVHQAIEKEQYLFAVNQLGNLLQNPPVSDEVHILFDQTLRHLEQVETEFCLLHNADRITKPGDGLCFFHALLEVCPGLTVELLATMVISFALVNFTMYKDFVPDLTKSQYEAQLRQLLLAKRFQNAVCDQAILQAAADTCHVRLAIWSPGSGPQTPPQIFTPKDNHIKATCNIIHTWNHDDYLHHRGECQECSRFFGDDGKASGSVLPCYYSSIS